LGLLRSLIALRKFCEKILDPESMGKAKIIFGGAKRLKLYLLT
jgi:hypothetical protein